MQKNPTTFNLTRATRDLVITEAESLGLTNSTFVESIIMDHAFRHGYVPSQSELDNLRQSFLVNGYSNLTGDFRSQISTFDPQGQACVIAFFYRLNLVKGFYLSTRKMANLFKNGELCYLAFGRIGRTQQLVNVYVQSSFSSQMNTIGPANTPDNEYLFFSNYQQFKVNKPYPQFPALLEKLNLPSNTNVIRVHYSELPVIADAINQI